MLLVGGVGYTYLGDLSFGATLVERLSQREWPDDVVIEDVSYNPITVMEWLRDDPRRFDRAVLVTAVERGRPPGSLHRTAWEPTESTPERVQDCVAAAITGTISLDNLLVIGTHFNLLPERTEVVELEPVATGWGEGLSDVAEELIDQFATWLRMQVASEDRVAKSSAGVLR
jgi:hydrogenase maturation protease